MWGLCSVNGTEEKSGEMRLYGFRDGTSGVEGTFGHMDGEQLPDRRLGHRGPIPGC